MEEINKGILNKKNIITLLIIGIMVLVIPAGVRLVSQQQVLKSKAAADPITFTGPNVSADKTTISSTSATIELRSPLGPPVPVESTTVPTIIPTCTVRPPCLDDPRPCLPFEPEGGYCPPSNLKK